MKNYIPLESTLILFFALKAITEKISITTTFHGLMHISGLTSQIAASHYMFSLSDN
jgi:hypothetical protein